MNRIAIGTILASNYSACAKVMAESLSQFHPDIPVYMFVPDAQRGAPEFFGKNVRLLGLPDLAGDGLRSRLFAYNRKQLLVSFKPTLLRYLLSEGYASALFLDPDMLVLGDMSDVFEQVAGHALTLTPHFHRTGASGYRMLHEQKVLLAGMYNGGCIGVSDRSETREFLAWWETRLAEFCDENVVAGLHYDQRWLDLAPGFVRDLHLIRDPGINLAYWSLPDLRVEEVDGTLMVEDHPCRLFHFSGYRPERPDEVTCFMPELKRQSLGPFAVLFDLYSQKLRDAGWKDTSRSSWPWDSYTNGAAISAYARQRYRTLGASAVRFGDPFEVKDRHSYFYWSRVQEVLARIGGIGRALVSAHPVLQRVVSRMMASPGG